MENNQNDASPAKTNPDDTGDGDKAGDDNQNKEAEIDVVETVVNKIDQKNETSNQNSKSKLVNQSQNDKESKDGWQMSSQTSRQSKSQSDADGKSENGGSNSAFSSQNSVKNSANDQPKSRRNENSVKLNIEKQSFEAKTNQLYQNDFVAKNGCCRACMKSFSSTGKSCLC